MRCCEVSLCSRHFVQGLRWKRYESDGLAFLWVGEVEKVNITVLRLFSTVAACGRIMVLHIGLGYFCYFRHMGMFVVVGVYGVSDVAIVDYCVVCPGKKSVYYSG